MKAQILAGLLALNFSATAFADQNPFVGSEAVCKSGLMVSMGSVAVFSGAIPWVLTAIDQKGGAEAKASELRGDLESLDQTVKDIEDFYIVLQHYEKSNDGVRTARISARLAALDLQKNEIIVKLVKTAGVNTMQVPKEAIEQMAKEQDTLSDKFGDKSEFRLKLLKGGLIGAVIVGPALVIFDQQIANVLNKMNTAQDYARLSADDRRALEYSLSGLAACLNPRY